MSVDYPYQHTKAARALSEAIDNRSEDGISLRQLAARLGYRSAVVLSHLRTGRLPIPVDRAVEIAKTVGLDHHSFLLLVLEQRHPDVNFKKAFGAQRGSESDVEVSPGLARLTAELEELAGRPLNELSREHIAVMQEIVCEQQPRRRWVSVAEAVALNRLRTKITDFARNGLSQKQLEAVSAET